MNKKIFIAGAVAAALCGQACSESEPQVKNPVEAGTEISFGAALDDEGVQSRTVYGEPITAGGKTLWPIYWSYSTDATKLDRIFIYSPQAMAERNQAIYTVKPDGENQTTTANINKDGVFGVQAGGGDQPYDFYAVYPASAVKAGNGAQGTSINATLPAEQTVAWNEEIPYPYDDQDSKSYEMTPDMSNCLMIAENKGVDLSTTSTVNLQFQPFSSVLDITIPGATTSNTKTLSLITSVQIIADAPIAGDFSYDFSAAAESQFTYGSNASNTVTVDLAAPNSIGIPLGLNNSLRLQAFLLPNPAVKTLQVKVFSSDAQVWTKTLVMSSGSIGEDVFAPRKINRVTLPKAVLDNVDFDYSSWIAQLDPNIYLSEISLPGSTSSFSYVDGDHTKLQTLTLQEQFQAGIRVFRCHIWLYPGESIYGGDNHFGINVNGGSEIMRLTDAVNILAAEMKNGHQDEFCVLMVADYSPSSGSSYDYATFLSRFKTITEIMQDNALLPEKPIDANTTIGDVRGKVILKLQMNAQGTNNTTGAVSGGSILSDYNINPFLAKLQSWSNVEGAPVLFNWFTAASGNELFYSNMTFEKIGTMDYSTYGYGNNNAGSITTSGEGLLVDAASLLTPTWGTTSYWSCNASRTATVHMPSEADLADSNKMWYIYAAQAAPSSASSSQGMVTQAVNAIKNYYKIGATKHNKFYMTYLGGASGSATADAVTNSLVPHWKDAIGYNDDGTNSFGARPFGWVLFNNIPSESTPESNFTAAGLVKQSIRTVISKNNDIDFRLARKNVETPVQAAPAGDVSGTHAGGPIF